MERYERSVRDSSNNGSKFRYLGGGDPLSLGLLGGLSWPPRSYSCTFCRREFRSAQALGGHMNVHRRDRARLRQSPPWDPPLQNPRPDLNLSPSPNSNPRTHLVPNLNFSPPTNPILHHNSSSPSAKLSNYTFPSLASPLECFTSSSSSVGSREAVKNLFKAEASKCFVDEDKKSQKVEELEMEKDLDLELRLGYG